MCVSIVTLACSSPTFTSACFTRVNTGVFVLHHILAGVCSFCVQAGVFSRRVPRQPFRIFCLGRLWICTFTLAVSGGAVLLLPMSIVANEVLLIYPKSYYLQWVNTSLIQGTSTRGRGGVRVCVCVCVASPSCATPGHRFDAARLDLCLSVSVCVCVCVYVCTCVCVVRARKIRLLQMSFVTGGRVQ